ncbi:Cytochrome P450 monooxygenase BOT1 [Hyphodiscus hymeniophilus]|uniref:Cytochrome P450 monooxygenase BOT1 n=1 Tax=Hyphodiscus hymeniophilus TaxID=353542 RepID=A0A9P6VFV5_9HELO|nr:Cytochrome P450 monooxygenase BOT1 [Hyphodiscus hymeniophilus]
MLTKDPEFYEHLGQSEALFGLVDEEEHKQRFKLVADLFSKKQSEEFEHVIRNHSNRLCALFLKGASGAKPVNVARGFRAVALDIAQEFVYGYVPGHLQGLKSEKFETLLVDTTFDVMDWTAWCFRNFPLTLSLSNNLPQWLRKKIFPGEAANIASFEVILQLVKENLVTPHWKRDCFLSRFANVVPISSLTSECQGTVFGGVINLANMLPYGAFCVCEDDEMQQLLYEELKAIWPNAEDEIPTFEQLQKLPILNGIVKETLRLMHGILVGPPRVVPSSGAEVDGHYVPPKSVVATSSLYLHTNPEVFPEPERFMPERWHKATPEMERSLVPFSKGRRMCPGKQYENILSDYSLMKHQD